MDKAEKLLIESLDTFKDFFDHAYDLVHIVYLDGTIIYINNAWEKLLEYTLDEIHGRNILDVVAPDERGYFASYRQKVIDGQANDEPITIRLQAKTGHLLIVEGMVSVKVNPAGISYTRGIFRDITLRRQNELKLEKAYELLRESEKNLRHLLLGAPDAVIVIDEESKIIFWNPKATEMFGWSEQEVTGKHLADTIVPPQHKIAHTEGMQRYLRTGETHILNQTVQITALHKSGREFYIALTLSATTQNDKPAFVGFIRNIDEEKKLELELKNNKYQLESSNKKLEQFAFVTSHDLQEPLRKISFFTNLLITRYRMGDEETKYLEKTNEAARRMSFLIQGLLSYSRLSQKNLGFEPTDLHEIASNVLSDFELLIEQKQATICMEQLPVIAAVPVQMHQLVSNLLGNSLKFTRRNVAPEIRITVQKHASLPGETRMPVVTGRQYYQVSIQDNGIGFSPEYAEKIFHIFHRLNERSQFEGYGIGLAVCQKIVENHNGVIWAESTSSKGACFHFILPEVSEHSEYK